MSRNVIITWLAIGAVQAIALGAVAHLVTIDPGRPVDQARVAVHGNVILPYRN